MFPDPRFNGREFDRWLTSALESRECYSCPSTCIDGLVGSTLLEGENEPCPCDCHAEAEEEDYITD